MTFLTEKWQISDNFGQIIKVTKMSQNVRNLRKFAKSDKKLGHFGAHRPKLVTKNFFTNFPLTLLKSLDHGFLWVQKNTINSSK